jgi:protein-tyrosine phosphatase
VEHFVDIHCHLLPALDDGAKSIEESLAMARMAVDDGIGATIVTPHQLGASSLVGDVIRRHTAELRQQLQAAKVPLEIYAGADVRVEPDLVHRLQCAEILTLADRKKHVLLELPHELFFPIDHLLKELLANGIVGILSHPERNEGLLSDGSLLYALVDQGGLLQITAGSLLGAFGSRVRQFAESLLVSGLVHFVATDAHGTRARPPLMKKAFERVCELTDESTALDLCARHPASVVVGRSVPGGKRATFRTGWRRWWKTNRLHKIS